MYTWQLLRETDKAGCFSKRVRGHSYPTLGNLHPIPPLSLSLPAIFCHARLAEQPLCATVAPDPKTRHAEHAERGESLPFRGPKAEPSGGCRGPQDVRARRRSSLDAAELDSLVRTGGGRARWGRRDGKRRWGWRFFRVCF